MYGGPRLLADLVSLGYQAEFVTASNGQVFVVLRDYTIALGRFAGQTIGLGLLSTPDFPKTVAAAIQVRSQPHLYDLNDSIPNIRNIQPSPLGEEWRYWSKNFGWSEERSARRLMSQVNQIFHDA